MFLLFKNYLIASTIMLLVLKFESIVLNASILNTFILIFSGGMVYLLSLLILKDRFMINTINNFKLLLIDRLKK